MDTAPVKVRDDKVPQKSADREDSRSARFGLLEITRPLDLNPDEQGGDPYNSTGRFTRIKD